MSDLSRTAGLFDCSHATLLSAPPSRPMLLEITSSGLPSYLVTGSEMVVKSRATAIV